MSRDSRPPNFALDFTTFVRDGWDSIPIKLKVAFLAFFDATIGLRYKWGIFSVLIHGDPLWMLQFFEFILSGMYILYQIINNSSGYSRNSLIAISPILILVMFAFCLDQLFVGQEATMSTTFNLSSTFFTGLYWGAAYLSIAVGLTVIYKVQKFGNFAQAEMMLVGAYVGFTMMWSPFFYTLVDGEKILNIDVAKDEVLTWDLFFWACVTAFIITGFLGVLIDRLIYQRFRKKNALPQAMMIASLGMSMILRGLLYLRYGADQYLFVPDIDWRLSSSRTEFSADESPGWWPEFMNQTARFRFGDRTSEKSYDSMDQTACVEEGRPDNFSSEWTETGICNVTEYLPFYEIQDSTYYLQYTKSALIIGVFGAVFLLILMLNWTRLGRQMRAVADNPDLAASSGINVERIHATTAFLAAGMSGFGGALFGMYVRVNPNVGFSILLPAFSVIVLGTLGSVRGALIAAIIVGLVRSISEPVLIGAGSELDRPSYAAFGEAMPYMFLIAVLMLMPSGLGDALEKWRIDRARKNKGTIFTLSNVSISILLFVCLLSFGFFGFLLWAILLFFFYLFRSIKIEDQEQVERTIVIWGQEIGPISYVHKASLFVAIVLQIVFVSILDANINGSGLVYYLVDYVFLLLSTSGVVLLWALIWFLLIPDLRRLMSSSLDLSLQDKQNLFVAGLSIVVISLVADYLVNGNGDIFIIIDYTFLLFLVCGFLCMIFSAYLSRPHLVDFVEYFGGRIHSLSEIQKWYSISGSVFFVVFIYYIDTVTSGSGILYYLIDLFYLFLLVLGIALFFIVFINSRSEISHRLNLFFILVGITLLYLEAKIEPGQVRDTESKLYVRELAFISILISSRDLQRFSSRFVEPVQIEFSRKFQDLKRHVNLYSLIFGLLFLIYSNFLFGLIILALSFNEIRDRLSKATTDFKQKIDISYFDRTTEKGSWFVFFFMLIVLIFIVNWLPSVSAFTKTMQTTRIIVLVCVFSILALSLNLHTGFTGMTNFGVIFFAGIGAIAMAILTVPEERPGGHGWPPIAGLLVAILVSGVAGWLLAYPTANLRMDYFAIVTISLGEVVRISMRAEPLLRAGTGTTAIGIQLYDLPLEDWYVSTIDDSIGEWLNLGQAAPYTFLLAIIAMLSLIFIWGVLEMMLSSPWGRILRAIREDEEVTMHHGHNVFYHKSMSLAVGGAIAGFGGAIWAWLNMSILDDFITPAKSTFLIWAAFIVGGKANNRGVVIGAFMIALTEPLFNLLSVARGDKDSVFHDDVSVIDEVFSNIILNHVGKFNSDLSIIEPFGTLDPSGIIVNLSYLKLALIGFVILFSLLISERGLLPEVPKRPENPGGA